MDKYDIRKKLENMGAIRSGHFLRASGKHATGYVQCARVFEDYRVSEKICAELANLFRDQNIELVVGPAVGGVILGYEVARQLSARSVYCERREGAMILRRGFTIEKGARILIVEDEIMTGTSVNETLEILRAVGGNVVGVGCIVDKSGGRVSFGCPFHALVSFRVDSYKPGECPLCQKGVPLDTVDCVK